MAGPMYLIQVTRDLHFGEQVFHDMGDAAHPQMVYTKGPLFVWYLSEPMPTPRLLPATARSKQGAAHALPCLPARACQCSTRALSMPRVIGMRASSCSARITRNDSRLSRSPC